MNEGCLSREQLASVAEDLEARGSLEAALVAWRDVATRKASWYVCWRLGMVAYQLDKLSEAEEALMKSVELRPSFAPSWRQLGILYLDRGEPAKAVLSLSKSLEIEPTASNFTLLGAVQDRLGDRESACASYQRALTIDSEDADALYNLGMCYAEKNPSQAISHLNRALEVDPRYPDAHHQLGLLYHKVKDHSKAEDHFRQALNLNSQDSESRMYLGNILWRRGAISDAKHEFEEALKTNPKSGLVLLGVAIFHSHEGSERTARKLFNRAIEAEPENPILHRHFAQFLKRTGDVDAAAYHFGLSERLAGQNDGQVGDTEDLDTF